MLTLISTFVLMLVLVFLGLIVQRWLFRNSTEKNDPEWELYQHVILLSKVLKLLLEQR